VPPKSENPLQFLTDAHVVIVAGKGGVGKTTVTAVLARAAADRGLRVLVVELDGKPALAKLIGDDAGYLALTPAAAPGIDDIVVLGKIKQLEQSGDFDLVVVDGPAAGHAITFLMAPVNLLKLVRGGPIRSQAIEVSELLTDPARSQVVLVTLPETTPVNEVLETAGALRHQGSLRLGPVVVNAFDEGEDLLAERAPEDSSLRAAAEFRNARRELHRREANRLSDMLDCPQIRLPLVASAAIDHAAIGQLAARLAEGP
jgi:arsenite-transporting ATPase